MSRGPTTLSHYSSRYGLEIVKLALPGNKWTQAQQLTCNRCGFKGQQISASRDRLMPPEITLKKFSAQGWDVRKGGKSLCPNCSTPASRQAHVSKAAQQPPTTVALPPPQKTDLPADGALLELPSETITQEETKDMAEPIPMTTSAVEPDRLTKRRIHDEISGNWDEASGRYIGAASDQSIADQLKVPRAWVATIRADFFGDDGTNSEMVEFKDKLDKTIGAVEAYMTDAMNLAARFEKMVNELKEMRTRMERVEKSVLPRR